MRKRFFPGRSGALSGALLALGILIFAQVPTAVLTGVVKDPAR